MKTILCLLLFTTLFAYGGKVDVLDPEYQKQIEEYETLLREWKESGGDYKVTVREVHNKPQGVIMVLYPQQYFYEITLPQKINNYVLTKEAAFLGEMLDRYFENEDFSFFSAVLFISKKTKHGSQWYHKRIIPIDKKKSESWNKTKNTYASLFYGSMENFLRNLDVLQTYVQKKMPDKYYWTPGSREILYHDMIKQYNSTKDKKSFSEVLRSQTSIYEWCLLFMIKRNVTLDTWNNPVILPETITPKLFTYCAWARPFAKADPDFAALAAGVVILDGYRFDFESGDYQLNEIGRMGVEFVAEFPHPQTAFFLKTIRNGGNQDFVDGLLQKFGNADEWNKLFGTATPPDK